MHERMERRYMKGVLLLPWVLRLKLLAELLVLAILLMLMLGTLR